MKRLIENKVAKRMKRKKRQKVKNTLDIGRLAGCTPIHRLT